MSLVRLPIPNLIQGVSQQPPSFRLNQQAAEQINCAISVTDGLQRRPPLEHVAQISSGALGAAALLPVDRGPSTRYWLVVTDGDLKIYSDTGAAKAVAFPDGKGYLAASAPKSAFKALTVDGRTYLLNTAIVPAMAAATAAAYAPTAVIQVRQAGANDYIVTIDGSSATHTAVAADSTTDIAFDLHAAMVAAAIIPAGATSGVQGSSIFVTLAAGGTNFTISQSSNLGDTAMALVKDSVQAPSDLPRLAYHGMKVQVKGSTAEASSWFVFVNTETGSGMGEGVWEETVAPGVKTGLNAATMPLEVIDDGSGGYICQEIDWTARTVGDAASNSDPSFVGTAINALFLFKNRLGFLSGRNVICSEAGEFLNFFRTSVVTLLDGDPIDVTVTAAKKDTALTHAIPYAERLLVFSEDAQFFVQGSDLFTPSTVSADVIGEYATASGVSPVSGGRSVLFAQTRGSFSAVREFFLLPDESAADAPDITAHVPKYLAGAAELMDASTDLEMLVVKGATHDNKLFVYNWLWEAGTKIQSAWHTWEFDAGDNILALAFLDTDLYMVVQRADALYLDKIALAPGASDPDSTFKFHLDRRVDESQVAPSYSAGLGTTTLTLPWAIPAGATVQAVVRPDAATPTNVPGSVLPINSAAGTEVILDGDHSAEEFYVGITYESAWTMGEVTIKAPTVGGGLAPADLTRLQLRSVTFRIEDTGYFAWEVTPEKRDTYTEHVYGIRFNHNWILGAISLGSGEAHLAAFGKSDTTTLKVVSDSFMPFKLMSASVKANANSKGSRQG